MRWNECREQGCQILDGVGTKLSARSGWRMGREIALWDGLLIQWQRGCGPSQLSKVWCVAECSSAQLRGRSGRNAHGLP